MVGTVDKSVHVTEVAFNDDEKPKIPAVRWNGESETCELTSKGYKVGQRVFSADEHDSSFLPETLRGSSGGPFYEFGASEQPLSPREFSKHVLTDTAYFLASLKLDKLYMGKPPCARYTIPRRRQAAKRKSKRPAKLQSFFSSVVCAHQVKDVNPSSEEVLQRVITVFLAEQRNNFCILRKSPGVAELASSGLTSMCSYAQKLGLFADINDEHLAPLVKSMQIRTINTGQWCFRKGDSPLCPETGGWYNILQGSVGVYLQEDTKPVGTLSAGDSFGSQGFVNDTLRNASIKANEECIFGVINKEAFVRFQGKSQPEQSHKVAEFLQSMPQFLSSQWTLQKLGVLASFFSLVTTKPRMQVIGPAQCGTHLGFIYAGEFEVVQVSRLSTRFGIPVSKDQKEISVTAYDVTTVVATLKPKDVFGDRPIIFKKNTDEEGALQSLVSVGDNGKVFVIEADNFRRCISKWGYKFQPCYVPEKSTVVASKHLAQKRWNEFRRSLIPPALLQNTGDQMTSGRQAISSRTSFQKYRRHRVMRPVTTINLKCYDFNGGGAMPDLLPTEPKCPSKGGKNSLKLS